MASRDDGDTPLRRNDLVRPVQGMLEHGSGPDKGAVLFGLVAPQPSLNERFEALSLASGQNYRPQVLVLLRYELHGAVLRFFKESFDLASRSTWQRRSPLGLSIGVPGDSSLYSAPIIGHRCEMRMKSSLENPKTF